MNLVTRRAKDKYTRERVIDCYSSEDVFKLLLELREKFYSKRMRLHDIWLTVWKNHYRDGPHFSDHVHELIRQYEKKRKAELALEPEYHI